MNLNDILQEIFPSKEMADYLSTASLDAERIADAVRGAPISLLQKREMLYALAENTNETLYTEQANEIDCAIREMAAKSNGVFYVKDFWLDEEIWEVDPNGYAPFLTMEQAMEGIREIQAHEEVDENTLWWFGIEKWSPDEKGNLIHIITYYVVGDEICYFKRKNHDYWADIDYYESTHLNLPVPFRPGDIVEIDCRPFAPVIHAAILEVGDNHDCCCLQAIFPWGEEWSMGAVKHGHLYPRHYAPVLSPLYRISAYQGPLTEKEQLLLQVSRHLRGDDKKGRMLLTFMLKCRDKGRKDQVETHEILAYMAAKENSNAIQKSNNI